MVFTILVGIIGLGVMVFIHELGHFVAAKLSGVTVETLSLGWGPRLAGFAIEGGRLRATWTPAGLELGDLGKLARPGPTAARRPRS